MTVAHKSGLATSPPSAKRIVHVPMDGGEWCVGISDQDYVYQVRMNGVWYYAHESISAAMLAQLQAAYEGMEP